MLARDELLDRQPDNSRRPRRTSSPTHSIWSKIPNRPRQVPKAGCCRAQPAAVKWTGTPINNSHFTSAEVRTADRCCSAATRWI